VRNPQLFQKFQSLRQGQNNPEEFLTQTFNSYTPEQIEQFKQFASGFGVTEEQLDKYGIGAKK